MGRVGELEALHQEFLEVELRRPRLVLVEGPAGIGKTQLARQFLADHPKSSVRRAQADETETNLAYGVLEQLFGDMLWPAGAPSRVEQPLAVGARLLNALGELHDYDTLAIIIDDAHWADLPSLQALLFMLRRLQADPVLVMLLVRGEQMRRLPPGVDRLLAAGAGRRITLSGLPDEAIAELARVAGAPSLSAGQLHRLAEHTRGNPLHLTALLNESSGEELRSADAPLPVPRSFAALIAERFAACSPPTRRLVTATVVLGGAVRVADAARLGSVTDPLAALDQAVGQGLLERRGVSLREQVRPSHPLVSAAIYQELGSSERAQLHLAAAQQVSDEASQLRHRMAAAVGTDEALAADLIGYAHRQAGRGAWATAAAALSSASRVASDRTTEEAAVISAVEYWLVAGDLREAADLLQGAARFPPSAQRDYVAGWFALAGGRFEEAEKRLSAAWQASSETEQTHLRSRIAQQLAQLHLMFGRGHESAEWARRSMEASSVGTSLGDPASVLAMGLAIAGKSTEAFAALHRAGESPLTAEQTDSTTARGIIRLYLDDLSGARSDLTAVLEAAKRLGTFHLALNARGHLATVEYRSGNWEDALIHGELGVAAGVGTDQLWLATCMHSDVMSVYAQRGDWESAETHVAAAVQGAALLGDLASRGCARVVSVTDNILPYATADGISEPGIHTWRELRTEALVRVDRLTEAEAELAPFEELAAARERHSTQAAAGRVRGLLEAAQGRNERATTAFEEALEHARMVPMPFERALIQLFYGAFLRRSDQRKAAAVQLGAAHEVFDRLGARPYLEVGDRELAGCGQARARRSSPEANQLTPYETAVARLVVEGLSNREVAGELVISVKTVEYHLSAIYRKLDLRSRSQLAVHMRRELVGKS